jgi:hypothetical protein
MEDDMIDREYVEMYVNAVQVAEYRRNEEFEYRTASIVSAEYGRRFVRIVVDNGTQRMVHAFVDLTNGDVVKAAGWTAPQRGVNGLAVRFNLLDDESRENCFARCGNYGYLYA